MAEQATYTVTEDYYEPLSDGSGDKRIFRAGQKISWETAYMIGLVKTKTPPRGKPELPEKDT